VGGRTDSEKAVGSRKGVPKKSAKIGRRGTGRSRPGSGGRTEEWRDKSMEKAGSIKKIGKLVGAVLKRKGGGGGGGGGGRGGGGRENCDCLEKTAGGANPNIPIKKKAKGGGPQND